jgi:hypothetical protein
MVARNLRDVVGKIGSTNVRLASWRTPEQPAYQRRYVPVKPQDRFVSGQQFEFTADLEFRDWVIDDFSGGSQWTAQTRWQPDAAHVAFIQHAYINRDGVLLTGFRGVDTFWASSSSAINDVSWLVFANSKMWGAKDTLLYEWGSDDWISATAATGGASDQRVVGMASIGSDMFVSLNTSGTIRKITNYDGSPSEALHWAKVTDDATAVPLVEFNDRLYGLWFDDLYEINPTSANTRTQRADLRPSQWIQNSTNAANTCNRLGVSDVGPVWFQRADNGFTYVWEYNVASDTSRRIGQLPGQGGRPFSIFVAFGFVFVSYIDATDRGYVWYGRGGQTGQIGGWQHFKDSAAPLILGTFDDSLVLSLSTKTDDEVSPSDVNWIGMYNFSSGGWSQLGHTFGGQTAATSGTGMVFEGNVFITGADAQNDGVLALTPDEGLLGIAAWDGLKAITDHPIITTGFWHFGYPNVEKILTEVTVEVDKLVSGDNLILSYAIDGDPTFTALPTFTATADNYFHTFVVSTSSTTVKGFTFSLKLEVRSGSNMTINAIRSRATSNQSRREWQLVLDASDSSSGGYEQNDVEWLQDLEDLKTAKNVVVFTDPWQKKDEGTADTFDVIVEDIITPPATHSPSDQREAIVILRDVVLV